MHKFRRRQETSSTLNRMRLGDVRKRLRLSAQRAAAKRNLSILNGVITASEAAASSTKVSGESEQPPSDISTTTVLETLSELGCTLSEARGAARMSPSLPSNKAQMAVALAAFRAAQRAINSAAPDASERTEDPKTSTSIDRKVNSNDKMLEVSVPPKTTPEPNTFENSIEIRQSPGVGVGLFAKTALPRWTHFPLDMQPLVSIPTSSTTARAHKILFLEDDGLFLLDKLFCDLKPNLRNSQYFADRGMTRKAILDPRLIHKLQPILARMKHEHSVSEETLLTCWQLVKCSLTRTLGLMVGITTGLALFARGALLNHSCVPNCVAVVTPDTFQLWTSRAIAQNEELTISYISGELLEPMTFNERDALLRKVLHGKCRCSFCDLQRKTTEEQKETPEPYIPDLLKSKTKKKSKKATPDGQITTVHAKSQENGAKFARIETGPAVALPSYAEFNKTTSMEDRRKVLLSSPMNSLVYRLVIGTLGNYLMHGIYTSELDESRHRFDVPRDPADMYRAPKGDEIAHLSLYLCLVRRTVQCMGISRSQHDSEVQLLLWQAYVMLMMEGRVAKWPYPLDFATDSDTTSKTVILQKVDHLISLAAKHASKLEFKFIYIIITQLFAIPDTKLKSATERESEVDKSVREMGDSKISSRVPPIVMQSPVYRASQFHYNCLQTPPVDLQLCRFETQPFDNFVRKGFMECWKNAADRL